MKLAELLAVGVTDESVLAARGNVESLVRERKGVRNLLCEAPEGPFRQKVPDTFSSLGIVGAGLMGRAVAAAAIGGGLDVVITDVDADAVDAAKAA
ncbi:MAG: 3-hydroxyacyl-CoA dehydrogenase NAD-binding domain-containing protein, partial [Planctomycetota bacterium]|nr:3-hydroxyacyl-CoA dehydrogenase NAD-binding domain-containing protein [Planctomycetota bacterium]